MTDREKVIGLLKETAEYFRECRSNASFASKAENHFWELQNAATEAVELLEKQEPKTMTEDEEGWHCPSCGMRLLGKTESGYPVGEIDLPDAETPNFCPQCGQAVKYECKRMNGFLHRNKCRG